MNSTLHQRCKVHTSVLGEKPHLSPVPLFWVCGGPHNLVQANLELSAQPWKCLQGDPDCKGACRGQIFGRRRFSRRNSYGGGGAYPRNPVLGACDQEYLFPFPLDHILPMMVRLNSAPLRRAFQQEIGGLVNGMGLALGRLAHRPFSLLPYLPENTYYVSVPQQELYTNCIPFSQQPWETGIISPIF